ncbi:MAG: gamma-glutamyl-gamma-aminobutyrate hydrolase family protein [Eggerthella lenta]
MEGGADANRRAARELVERLDGLVLAGGGISTRRRTATKRAWRNRERVRWAMPGAGAGAPCPRARSAHAGICRGMQVLNVALGGTLYQDVHACGLTDAAHQQKPLRRRAPARRHRAGQRAGPGAVRRRGRGHGTRLQGGMVCIARDELGGLRLRRIALVNTMHHQAIACVADPLQVSAVSGDGLVEGLRTHRGASTSACSGILRVPRQQRSGCSKPWLPPEVGHRPRRRTAHPCLARIARPL